MRKATQRAEECGLPMEIINNFRKLSVTLQNTRKYNCTT